MDARARMEAWVERCCRSPGVNEQTLTMVRYKVAMALQFPHILNNTNWEKEAVPRPQSFDTTNNSKNARGGQAAANYKKKPQKNYSSETGDIGLSHQSLEKPTQNQLEKRRARFSQPAPKRPTTVKRTTDGHILGYCQDLEKEYLRLTSAPDPARVRPPDVLEKSLDYVLGVFKKNHKYSYIIDQLASIRQDLKVQGVQTPFSVRVYETNARISIEHDDINEFHKCERELNETLYPTIGWEKCPNAGEFRAYTIYYLLYVQHWDELNTEVYKVRREQHLLKSKDIQRALSLVDSKVGGDIMNLLQLVCTAPRHSQMLLKNFLLRERISLLNDIVSCLRGPSGVSVSTIAKAMNLKDAKKFLDTLGVKYSHGELTSKALPHIQRKLREFSGPVDLKGQI